MEAEISKIIFMEGIETDEGKGKGKEKEKESETGKEREGTFCEEPPQGALLDVKEFLEQSILPRLLVSDYPAENEGEEEEEEEEGDDEGMLLLLLRLVDGTIPSKAHGSGTIKRSYLSFLLKLHKLR